MLMALLLSACGNSTPNGNDADVKELVLDITVGEIKKQLTPVLYQQVTKIPVTLMGMEVTYEALVKNKSKEKNSEVIDLIDKTMNEMSISLENIRINSVNDEIEKSENSADIVVNGKSSPITYTAQRNSEGDIYVEVFGL